VTVVDALMTPRGLDAAPAYEPPALVDLGTLHEQTLTYGCLFGKQFGGSDGFTFMGINVPISNCSQ
jgi:hypothetical protein